MVKRETVAERFESRLQFLSRIYAFVGPIGVLAVCGISQFIFTDYFSGKPVWMVVGLSAALVYLVAGRILVPSITRRRLAVEYIITYIIGLVAINYILKFPSPYMMALSVAAILVYFDFGLRWAVAGSIGQYAVVFIHGFLIHDNFGQYVDLVAYTMAPLAYAVFVAVLMNLVRQEIKALDANTTRAIADEQRIASLINNITDGVIAVNHSNQVMIYNAAALDVLDINIELKGKKLTDVFKPIDAEKQAVDISELLAGTTRPTINRDLRLKYTDGSIINLFLSIAPIYLGYGKSENTGYTIILRDITREKSLEEERDEFISVVSHELRTPIAIAEGNLSNAEFIVKKSGDIAKAQTALSEAHAQVLFLSAMINDLSTLSRAERGKLEVEAEPINVHDLMLELADNYKPEAEAKGLKLGLDLDPKLELLSNSKLYTREVLQNFITNAIKYTEKGSVTIGASPSAKGVTFTVTDTGIGISKSDQERIFDKFFRSEDFRTRKNSGTGLGLYVTMKLTRLIHAEIEIESELDKGSTFSITIPNIK
jgi:PAS domain S-box-containing protein